MSENNIREPMLEMFIFESSQLLEQLEQLLVDNEKSYCYTEEAVNEIFRVMHTIKGASTMMLFENIATLSHSAEDLFHFIRQQKPKDVDYSKLTDLVLECVDFIKLEILKIENGHSPDGDSVELIRDMKEFLDTIKKDNDTSINFDYTEKDTSISNKTVENQQYYISQEKTCKSVLKNNYSATIFFENDCGMENIRAYTIIHNLKSVTEEFFHIPEDIIESENSTKEILEEGFKIVFKANNEYDEIHDLFMKSIFIKDLDLKQLEDDIEFLRISNERQLFLENQTNNQIINTTTLKKEDKEILTSSVQQGVITVSVPKLDKLMDLVGELVISEAMVTQNPDLNGLILDNFHKAARQLNKITTELQDIVMSIRMVPLAGTFHKMKRVVRDMSKKLEKDIQLVIVGEDTEVDKNILEQISDPLMHLVRNAIDHGIETPNEREVKGKHQKAVLTLEAKNSGSDVIVLVKDDGRGLNKEKILERAELNGLLQKPASEMSDKEIFSIILSPGFSTKEDVSEFSGRGVGMDVVSKNIDKIGGSVLVDSVQDQGTIITLKIPLTLAIIEGMNIRVGMSFYTIPITAIRESFKAKESSIIVDPDQNEMILIRGQCYPVLRLHEIYNIESDTINISEGILIMVEGEEKSVCIFADELIGEQQVVVKPLPGYIKKIKGLSGCTLLGDGSISLILDVTDFVKK